MARWPWGRASDIFAYPSRHGGRERSTEAGEGEKGVPGGHALSLYNIVSFEKFPPRKNARNLGEPLSLKRLTLFPSRTTRFPSAGFTHECNEACNMYFKQIYFLDDTQRVLTVRC